MNSPVVCMVYREGKDYCWNDVLQLTAQIRKHCTRDIEIVVFADCSKPLVMEPPEAMPDRIIPLQTNWPGWWAKIEMFREPFPVPVVYFDLDTIITGNIDGLVDAALELRNPALYMLRGFYQDGLCSGVMLWRGDFSALYEAFVPLVGAGRFRIFPGGAELSCNTGMRWRGDQDYIRKWLSLTPSVMVRFVQDVYDGVCSYKVDVLQKGRRDKDRVKPRLPEGKSVVCFHGKPRPKEVPDAMLKVMGIERGA